VTARIADLAELPGWPRLLSVQQAAGYCGMSPPFFSSVVDVRPLKARRRLFYDRLELDAWVERWKAQQRPQDGDTTTHDGTAGDWTESFG